MGLPPNPIAPQDAFHVLLSDGVTIAGEGTRYVLHAEARSFNLRFDEAPDLDGARLTFVGVMHMRVVPTPPPI